MSSSCSGTGNDGGGGCCPDGSIGLLQQPKGYKELGRTIELIDFLPCYVVGEESCNRCILIFTDVFGFNSGRHRIIADELSKHGYYVVMPDLFRGDPPFIDGRNMQDCLDRIIEYYTFDKLKNDICNIVYSYCIKAKGGEEGKQRQVCPIGFCYGAYLWSCAMPHVQFTCCASPHPSLVNICNTTREDYKLVVDKFNCPIMFLNAKNDTPKQKPNGQIQKMLSDKPFGQHNVFKTYDKVIHGWTTRGDMTNINNQEATKDAFEQIIQFFNKHCNSTAA